MTQEFCPECGRPVEPGKACPSCLLNMVSQPTDALDADLSEIVAETQSVDALQHSRSHSQTHMSPDIETVRAAFPQLEILECVGRGGMGTVFKARQPSLDRFVALKILSETLAAKPTFAERFAQEGKLLARLSHPNIVSVYDFGQAETTDMSGDKTTFFFLILEFVDGVNLRQAMREERFSPEQALAIVPKICEALQYAHDEGVLHRDIKPENILLDTRGRIKIADFGIASVARWTADGAAAPLPKPAPDGRWHQPERLTETGQILGTPSYMAPEQRETPNQVDHRADIYSLGVVFYELLTGELPQGDFPVPSATTPVGAEVDEIVQKALERERSKRYQSAVEMKTQIETVTLETSHPEKENVSTSTILKSIKTTTNRLANRIPLPVRIALFVFLAIMVIWESANDPNPLIMCMLIVVILANVVQFIRWGLLKKKQQDQHVISKHRHYAGWGCGLMLLWAVVFCVTACLWLTSASVVHTAGGEGMPEPSGPSTIILVFAFATLAAVLLLPCVITWLGWKQLRQVRTTGNMSGWLLGMITALACPFFLLWFGLWLVGIEILISQFSGPFRGIMQALGGTIGTFLAIFIAAAVAWKIYRWVFPKPVSPARLARWGLGLEIFAVGLALLTLIAVAGIFHESVNHIYFSNQASHIGEMSAEQAKIFDQRKLELNQDFGKARLWIQTCLLVPWWTSAILAVLGSVFAWRHLVKIRNAPEKPGRGIGLAAALLPVSMGLIVLPAAILGIVFSLGDFGTNRDFATAIAALCGGMFGLVIAVIVIYLTCRWQGVGRKDDVKSPLPAEEMKTEVETTANVSHHPDSTMMNEMTVPLRRIFLLYGLIALALILLCVSLSASVILPIRWVQSRNPHFEVQKQWEQHEAEKAFWQTAADADRRTLDPAKFKSDIPEPLYAEYEEFYKKYIAKLTDVYDTACNESDDFRLVLSEYWNNDRIISKRPDGPSEFEHQGQTYHLTSKSRLYPFKTKLCYVLLGFMLSGGFSLIGLFQMRRSNRKMLLAVTGTVAVVSSAMLVILSIVFCWFTETMALNPDFASRLFDANIWGWAFLVPGVVLYGLSLLLIYLVYSHSDRCRTGETTFRSTLRSRGLLALALAILPTVLIPIGCIMINHTPWLPHPYSFFGKTSMPRYQELANDFSEEYHRFLAEHDIVLPPPNARDVNLDRNDKMLVAFYSLDWNLYQAIEWKKTGNFIDEAYQSPMRSLTDYRNMSPFYGIMTAMLILVPGVIIGIIHLVKLRDYPERNGVIPAGLAVFFWPGLITILAITAFVIAVYTFEPSHPSFEDNFVFLFAALVSGSLTFGGIFYFRRTLKRSKRT